MKHLILCALVAGCPSYLIAQPQQTTTTYTITTIAGNGSADFPLGDNGFARAAALVPKGVAVDPLGTLYVIDAGSATGQRPSTIRMVAASLITTLACNGPDGLGGPPWGPILEVHQALCGNLTGVALDFTNDVFIAQGGGRTIDILPIGAGVVAIDNSDVNGPQNMATDGKGNIFVADSGNCRIVMTDKFGGSVPVAGGTCGFSGDGGFASSAALSFPLGVAVDGSGNVYIADSDNARVRKVDANTHIITTVAGNGCTTYGAGDGGPATKASLCYPADVAVDGSGNLFIAEYNSGLIRRVDPTGTITTIAGGLPNIALGDGGPATKAHLQFPYSLAIGPGGTIYVSDSGNYRVRVLTPDTPAPTAPPTPVHMSISTTPDSGVAGMDYINVTVSGLPNAPANAGTTASFAATCGGATVATAYPTTITPIVGSAYRLHVLLPPTLSTGTYFVSLETVVGGSIVYSSNCSQAAITQPPNPTPACTYALGNNMFSVPRTGGKVDVNVIAGAGCSWTLANNYPTAITSVKGSPGSGNGTVTLTVAPSTAPRVMTLPLQGGAAGGPVTLTISQGVPGDFDGNGVPDVLLQLPDGSMSVWYLARNGLQLSIQGSAPIATPSTGITLVDAADLNGDGIPDLILQLSDGSIGVWYMSGGGGSAIDGFASISGPIQGWAPVASADLNGDGHPDLIIQKTDGTTGVWYLGGTLGNQILGYEPISGPIPGWKAVGSADLNRDGHPDLVLQKTDGSVGVWYLGGAFGNQIQGFLDIAAPSSVIVVGVTDMDGDGIPDLVLRETDGSVGVWYLGGAFGNQIQGFEPISSPGNTTWRELTAH